VANLLLPRAFSKITKLSFKTHNALQQIRLVAHGFTYFVFVLGLPPLRPFTLAERTLALLVELPPFFVSSASSAIGIAEHQDAGRTLHQRSECLLQKRRFAFCDVILFRARTPSDSTDKPNARRVA
jgi:hypothetical protein